MDVGRVGVAEVCEQLQRLEREGYLVLNRDRVQRCVSAVRALGGGDRLSSLSSVLPERSAPLEERTSHRVADRNRCCPSPRSVKHGPVLDVHDHARV